MPDDQSLLTRYAHSRDAEAFAQLVKRYTALVFSVACRVTGNITAAEDVTQDCFLTLASQAASIHGSLPAWLHRVALNRSMYVSRNEAKRQYHEIRASVPPKPAGESAWNQVAPLVDAALAKLPAEYREPLVRHFLLGQTQVQVAEDLHIGQATVSRRLQEGIERLREHLKHAGVACGTLALSSALVKNASAAVPTRLATSLAKMAMAGPGKVAAGTSIAVILIAKAKLIAAVAAMIVIVGVAAYNIVPLLRRVSSTSAFAPRPYLSKLVLQGDGSTQDSFSLAFQAAAKALGRDADYETVYALSTNAFCPAILDKAPKKYWHILAVLGTKAIQTVSARYGLAAEKLNSSVNVENPDGYRHAIAPNIIKALDTEKLVIVDGGWEDGLPFAGIITDAHQDGVMFGAELNGRQDNRLAGPDGVWSLAPSVEALKPHEADIITLRSVVARIRGQAPFQATTESAYGLKAMDFWIKEMSDTPGFCTDCAKAQKNKTDVTNSCAYMNALMTKNASIVAARYLRRIAPEFSGDVQSRLQSAAAHYDRIAALLTPTLSPAGPDSYSSILGDLSKQKAHAAKVLAPIKSEYVAVAHDLELAIANIKP
jgi:RNA polymerase sigma factor (sigma-70 family)